MTIQIRFWAFLLAALVISSAASAIALAEDKPPAGKEAKKAEEKKEKSTPASRVEELLAKIDELKEKRPESKDDFVEIQKDIEKAASEILKLEKDKESQAHQAAMDAFLQAGVQVLALGELKAPEQLRIFSRYVDHLQNNPLGAAEFQMAMGVAQSLEKAGNVDLAGQAYFKFGDIFANSDNQQLAGAGKYLQGAGRRVTLVGNKMELTGVKFDGEEFDVDSLKGKVVLVDFWATWCGPCVAEYPNMKKNYDEHHEQGFEIVGVSLDQSREALAAYLEDKQVPWITLHDEDNAGQHPAAEHYGVFGIPLMILIGRDGKVVSTHARGEELDRLLKKEFAKAKPAAGE